MPFFTLLPKGYFGGRVLLPEARRKLTKDEQERENQVKMQSERRGAWLYMGGPIKGFEDFEHVFIQRRQSHTTRKIIEDERASMLSVIAASHEVEAYIIDKELMEFFPEHI